MHACMRQYTVPSVLNTMLNTPCTCATFKLTTSASQYVTHSTTDFLTHSILVILVIIILKNIYLIASLILILCSSVLSFALIPPSAFSRNSGSAHFAFNATLNLALLYTYRTNKPMHAYTHITQHMVHHVRCCVYSFSLPFCNNFACAVQLKHECYMMHYKLVQLIEVCRYLPGLITNGFTT
jgi:hypothetical protein